MPSLVADAVNVEIGGREPWPDGAKLYQPYESKIPFIHVGNMIVSELEPIVALVSAKGINLTSHLDPTQKADMKAYMAMVEQTLINTELYLVWCYKEMWHQLTRKRYGSPYPWPLNYILPWRRRCHVRRMLSCKGWKNKSLEEIWEQLEVCFKALSERLGNQPYFFGEKPTELDALVYGHLFSILTTSLPESVAKVTAILKNYSSLLRFVERIDVTFFKETVLSSEAK